MLNGTPLPVLLTVIVLACPSVLRAQPPPSAPPAAAAWEIEPYVGVARHSPAGSHLGATANRDHVFLAVHLTGAIVRWQRLTVAYAPELVPLLLVSNTPTYHTATLRDTFTIRIPDGRKAVAGVGLSPVGFEGRVRVAPRLRLYAATATGIVMFTRATPVPNARSFNFTFEFGGGGDYRIRRAWWLRLGYKFHHFSNANSAPDNPGVDAKVFMVGLAHAIGKGQ